MLLQTEELVPPRRHRKLTQMESEIVSISCLIPELTLHPLAPTIDPRTDVSVLITGDPDNCAHPGVVCYAPLSRALINSFTSVPVVAENGRVNETVVALLVPTILKYRIPVPHFL